MEDSATHSSPSSILHPPSSHSSRRALWPAYCSESLSSVGTSLLSVAIFFYTQHYFAWSMKQNFLLAAGQGVVYVIGSLAAAPLTARFGRRRSLIAIYSVMTLCALVALVARSSPAVLVIALLGHTLFASINWPAVESLVTAGADSHAMSRRVGVYNLVWSTTNAVIFASSGVVIEHWRTGIFLIPAVAHATAALLMLTNPGIEPADVEVNESAHAAHVAPEPELFAKRTLALWLARISLPATYVVIFSLMAMMPSLPIMRQLTPAAGTLIASVWMIARVLMFIVLGVTTWWHTRPSLLLLSTVGMLIAFIGITTRPSDLPPLAGMAKSFDLPSMLLFQILLGAVLGVIYSGSLYFGMVLSEGATEHAGYHEALIGVGCVLGPGTAALVQTCYPGSVHAGVTAVSAVVTLTIVAACVAAIRAVKKPSPRP